MNGTLGYVAADVDGIDPALLCAELSSIGYSGVDWTMEQFDPLVDAPTSLAGLVAIAQTEGLSVPQLMVHQDYVTPHAELWEERVVRTEKALEAAGTAGIPSIGVVTGPNRWVDGWAAVGSEISERNAWDSALRAFERILARAESVAVDVCLEPCWGTLAWSRSTADEFLARVDGNRLRLTVDPSHFAISRDDVLEATRAWAERVKHRPSQGRVWNARHQWAGFLLPASR